MKVTGKLAKIDRIDAHILARFAAAVDPKPSVIPGEAARPFQATLTLTRTADYEEATMEGAAVA
jgi:transposase